MQPEFRGPSTVKSWLKQSALLMGALLFFVNQAVAAPVFDNDFVTALKIQAAAYSLNAFSNYQDMISHLPRAADRTFVTRQLSGHLHDRIKASYLPHNALTITFAGEQVTAKVIDLDQHRFSILGRDYVFDANESAAAAIGKIRGSSKTAGLQDLLEPRAEAILPLLLTWGAATALYLGIASSIGLPCAKEGWNSTGKCIELAAAWPIEAALFGVGLVVLAYNSIKRAYTDKMFDVTDIKCPQNSEPLRATILDSKQNKMSLSLFMSPIGAPNHLEIKSGEGTTEALYFHDDWSPAPELALTKASSFEARAASVIAEGARNLARLCHGPDSKAAYEAYKKKKAGALSVEPQPDSPTATVK